MQDVSLITVQRHAQIHITLKYPQIPITAWSHFLKKNCSVVAGGYSYDKVLSSCEIFNFSRRSWSYGAEMAQGVGNAAFTSYNNELYVSCGQYSEHGVYTSDKIQKYNIFSNQWCIITRYISPGECSIFFMIHNI